LVEGRNNFHALKFLLWDFSRRYPNLGRPIRFAGRLATQRDVLNYQRRLLDAANQIRPENRYIRPRGEATQAFVIRGRFSRTGSTGEGLSLLLNHLRIPYRELDPGEFFQDDSQGIPDECALLFYEGEDDPPHWVLQGGYGFAVVVFGGSDRLFSGDHETLCTVPVEMRKAKGCALLVRSKSTRFLPTSDGLRSPFSAAFISSLLQVLQRPLVTGMLPPQVGLRLDDVTGERTLDYLPVLLRAGWRPNLGIFTDDMLKADSNVIQYVSDQAYQGAVDLSPHGLSSNRFLFFNYPYGKEYTREEFQDLWTQVLKLFEKWGFPLSDVVNAHFHTVSKSCIGLFEKKNIRYYFSEKPPGKMYPHPDIAFLPAGDPTCTTGQDWDHPIVQIYSGDNSLACMQKDSLYDFMMHADLSKKERHPAFRISKRLELSLWCGFASFITTHEYLLSSLDEPLQEELWSAVNDSLTKIAPFNVSHKATLSQIGENCYNHTNMIIRSVETDGNSLIVKMTGYPIGNPRLGVFRKGRIDWSGVTRFAGRVETVIT